MDDARYIALLDKTGLLVGLTLVDAADFDTLNRHTWRLHRTRGSWAYVERTESGASIRMHREVCPDGDEVDHINRDTLDNRRANLRPATTEQNQGNSGLRSDNRSGYKGVYWNKSRRLWEARIRCSRVRIYLGCFDTAEKAHAAYCEAAKTHHGEFARTA